MDSNFSVPYWEAQDLAVEAVNLLYVNIDRCGFQRVIGDLSFLSDSQIDGFSNIKANLLPFVMRGQHFVSSIFTADPQTDEEVLEFLAGICEDYGGFFSYIIGFNKNYY